MSASDVTVADGEGVIVDALTQFIDAHGPITRQNLPSAKKAVPVGWQR